MMVLTRAQREAVAKLYQRNPDGSNTYREFRKRVRRMLLGGGAIEIYPYGISKMYVGIESDGYTHT